MRDSSWLALCAGIAAIGAASVISCAATPDDAVALRYERAGSMAPLLEGMGSHRRPISTRVPLAQRYFDQGLTLAYGFNHAEAERSFLEAARLDPTCAICYWGAALVLGPNINAPMSDAAVPRAYAHLTAARALMPHAAPRERALLSALGARYAPAPVADRAPLDRAYADAMRRVARQYPDDADILALYAEALMDLSPWNYWAEDGSPRENTPEILASLERAMQINPDHPGALHYYIHAVEASPTPERALGAADRLAHLVPGAGHLLHMPAHIYIRTGRYRDAALANERAIAADDRYATVADPENFYLRAYRPHNPHFLWAARTLEGRSEDAIRAARLLQAMVREGGHAHPHPGHGAAAMDTMAEHFALSPLYALVRFGRFQEILREPPPAEGLVYSRAVHHYARAIALSRLGQPEAAYRELSALVRLAAEPSLEQSTVSGMNSPSAVLAVAIEIARGELSADRGNTSVAIRHLERAVALEDRLRYMEPPDWHHPARQILGAVLLRVNWPSEAERVYREDLERLPENGFSLFGLAEALARQGKAAEAAEVRERFKAAFADADITLRASSF